MVISAGRLVRATIGPAGPLGFVCEERPDGTVTVTTKGPAGPSSENRASHHLFGDDDPGHDVVPVHAAVARAMERHGGVALARTGNPYHELLPAVLAQRVTAVEAISQWGELCRRWGEDIVVDGIPMRTPPRPDVLAKVPYHELHLLGVDRRRADALRSVARHGDRLIGGWRTDLPLHERTRSLALIPGVGEWTAAVAGLAAFGDPDALDVGDFHTKNTVAHALAGRARGTDGEMCEILRPYAGQRARVVMWLKLDGWRAPARGPKRRIVSIARL
ncbi:MAG: DNA-3-methyladenine glycosylase family protein [Actinomycetota bacterium]